jgi:ATP-dependent RNA helicase RhlE
MTFDNLGLIDPLLRAVRAEGYTEPTPIQVQAIPPVLAGRDLVGCAQTGTGKTAAFSLPILQRLARTPLPNGGRGGRVIRALILSPTRELASQIQDNIRAYGRETDLRSTVIFGGVGQNPQVTAVRRGVDILVATPGRLLDLIQQGHVRLKNVEVFVLDEADRMLDMGFIRDVRKIIAHLPTQRQTLLFSATMPADIEELAQQILDNPIRVEVTPQATTVELIDQSVFMVQKNDKRALLEHLLTRDEDIQRVLVFTRTKHGANRLTEQLARASITADAIHGNKSQSARNAALAKFKSGKIRVLVATDIASRGIDVDDVTHVVNYEMPNEPESYVHRIGRTARAGASGIAYSFVDYDERPYLRDIEKLIRLRLPVIDEQPYPAPERAETSHARPSSGGNNRNRAPRRDSNNGSNSNSRPPRRDSDRSSSPRAGAGMSDNRSRRPQSASGRSSSQD